MSVVDVDKTTSDRSNPMPQADDKVINPMAHQTVSTTYKPNGDSTRNRMQMVNENIYKYDSNNDMSILFGNAPDNGRPGLWIVKPTYDVTDELNA